MLRAFVLATALAVATVACSTPPTKEREQAESAMAAARAADAATYAPTEFSAAESALARYDAAVAQRDYRLALGLALEARDSAYEAARRAAEEKTNAAREAERLVTVLEALMRTGAARLSGAIPPKLTGPAAERVRAGIRTGTQALQEARSEVAKFDYRAAVTRLTPAVEALGKELEPPAGPVGRRGR